MTVSERRENRPVSETSTVIVIDQTGDRHGFDADDWVSAETGRLDVIKDGKRVAAFPPGYVGVYQAKSHK